MIARMDGKPVKCQNCGSENINAFSRIVGYFADIFSWNRSKKEELRNRRKGNYKV